jgi:hypothetical protein
MGWTQVALSSVPAMRVNVQSLSNLGETMRECFFKNGGAQGLFVEAKGFHPCYCGLHVDGMELRCQAVPMDPQLSDSSLQTG